MSTEIDLAFHNLLWDVSFGLNSYSQLALCYVTSSAIKSLIANACLRGGYNITGHLHSIRLCHTVCAKSVIHTLMCIVHANLSAPHNVPETKHCSSCFLLFSSPTFRSHWSATSVFTDWQMLLHRSVHPTEAVMHFPLCFGFPPVLEKLLRLREKFPTIFLDSVLFTPYITFSYILSLLDVHFCWDPVLFPGLMFMTDPFKNVGF